MSDALFNRSSCTRAFLTSVSLMMLLVLSLVTSVAYAADPERVTLDLVAEYNFLEGNGSTVNDVSGVSPALNLTIDNTTNTQWLECGGLSVNSTALISSGVPATKIIDGVKASEALTVEAWITPVSAFQSGPARIVTLSDGGYKRNVTLGQNNGVYQIRLRTTTAGDNGTSPYVQTPSNIAMSLVDPTHVVYTRDASGIAITYINGVASVTKTVGGSVSNWDDTMQFALANELGTDRHWLGKLFHVAVYDRALSVAEVTQNLNVGVVGTCGQAPSANFSFEKVTNGAEYSVDFDASASYDTDGSIVSYAWDFGDSSSASGLNVSHTYANAGQYSVTLIITDDQGATDQIDQTVAVLAPGRVVQDQILFYNFSEGAGTTVNDVSGVGAPVNLTIPDASKVSWLSCGGLSVDQATFISAASTPLKMFDAVQASDELTIEAWVTPENTTQSGPARIVTYSIDGSNRNFTLGQNKTNYDVRLRTTSTSNNGLSPNLSGTGNDATTTLTHVVYTRDTLGQAKLYKNGNLIESAIIGSSMDNWNNSYVFGLANENGTDRNWLGDIHLVAVYSRALIQQEVEQNFLQGGGDTCSNVNTAPVITAITDQTVLENTTTTISLNASDADNDVLTFSVTGLPGFATFNGTEIVVAPSYEAEGTYGPITVSVTDGTDTDSTTFTLTITNNNQSPEITSAPVTIIAEGQSYQYNVVATDNDGDALTYSLGVAPSGMSVNPLSGVIAWEPNFTSSGAELVIVNVTDGQQSVQQSYTLTINNTNQTPVINSTPVTSATENIAYQYTVVASDADGDALTYQLTTPLPGMSINASGEIGWIPSYTQSGDHAVTVIVSDGTLTATQSYVIAVVNTNQAPVLTAIADQTVVENNTISVSLSATDADSDVLTYSVVGLPSFASLNGAEITITPGYDDAGSYGPITVTVADGVDSDTVTFTITITNNNQVPQITSSPITISAEGLDYQYNVIATDVDGDAITYQLTTYPPGMSIDSGGVIAWTPSFAQSGDHAVTVTASDGSLTATQSFVIAVTNTNQAPVLAAIADQSVVENNTITVSLSATDADNDTLTYSVVGLPSFASLSGTEITATPGYDAAGSYGPVTVTVTDGVDSGTATFTINVTNNNQIPVITSTPVTTIAEGQSYQYSVTATDADSDALTYSLSVSPAGMSISLLSGDITWMPSFDASGAELVIVEVSDGEQSVQQSFTLTITNTNQAPVVTSTPTASVVELESYNYQIIATDPDGGALTYSFVGASPTGMQLDTNTGLITWIPQVGQAGQANINVEVSDGDLLSVIQSFTVDVSSANSEPELVSYPPLTAFVDQYYQYQINANDAEGDELSFSKVVLPSFLTLSDKGLISGTATEGDVGLHPIAINISDGVSTVEQNYELNVVALTAAQPASWGKDFWFVDSHQVVNDSNKLMLFITSNVDTQGVIESPLMADQRAPLPFSVSAGEVISVDYYTYYNVDKYEHDQLSDRSIHVSADDDIAVYVLFYKDQSTDAMSLIPTVALGNTYRSIAYSDTSSGTGTTSVIASVDGTAVTITPTYDFIRDDNTPVLAGQSFTVQLTKGQVYSFNSRDWRSEHVQEQTGSKIEADNPIAVFINHSCTNVPMTKSFCDKLTEQLPPTNAWGQEYALVPYFSRYGDLVRVVADKDQTLISVNGQIQRELNAGEFWEFILNDAQWLSATKPILVAHYSTSDTFDQDQRAADTYSNIGRSDNYPAYSLVNQDLAGYQNEYTVTVNPQDGNNGVLVVALGGAEKNETLLVDGVAVSVDAFVENEFCGTLCQARGGVNYSLAQIALDVGSHTVSMDSPFGIYEGVHGLKKFSDPFVLIEPSLDVGSKHYIFTTPIATYTRHFMNITVPSEVLGSVRLDGNVVDEGFFKQLEGSGLSYARLAINAGRHSVTADGTFGITVYGYDQHDSYGYIGGFGQPGLTQADNLSLSLNTLIPRVGEPLCMKAQLIDNVGTPLNDIGVAFTVNGVHSYDVNRFTGEDGVAEACFTGYLLGGDSITVSSALLERYVDVVWESAEGTNKPPVITSFPSLYALSGSNYSYAVKAKDPEQLGLSYSLLSAPNNMHIDENSGLIEWSAVTGDYVVDVQVMDLVGNAVHQTYQLIVNTPPKIIQVPEGLVKTDTGFNVANFSGQYVVEDADGDDIYYQIINGHEFFRITYNGDGTISMGGPRAVGVYSATVRISDNRGGYIDHALTVTIYKDDAPVIINQDFTITSSPTGTARVGEEYQYALQVDDPDGSELTYSLSDSPGGMFIDPTGLVRWVPLSGQEGAAPVTVQVSDGEFIHGQVFELTVQNIETQLEAEFYVNKRVVDQGEQVGVSAGYSGALGEVIESLLLDGESVALDESGMADVTIATSGEHILTYSIQDSLEVVTKSALIYVTDPTDTIPPVAVITTPTQGDEVTAPIGVSVTVDDDNLIFWQLFLQKGNVEQPQILAEGNEPVLPGSVVANIDPTMMMNGLYSLVLSAVDIGGSETVSQVVFPVSGNLKVGNFSFSQQDISISMSGLPITVGRTYDSRRRSENLDFGYGWSVDYQNITVDESMEPTKGWYQTKVNTIFATSGGPVKLKGTCINSLGKKQVAVTLPGGSVETFDVKPKSTDGGSEGVYDKNCYVVPGNFYTLEFKAVEGTKSTLKISEEQNFSYYLTDTDNGNLTLDLAGSTYTPISLYELTTKSGYTYKLDQGFGIRSVLDPNGYTLTYSENGIVHSDGKSVQFVRGDGGRIENIVDENDKALITYEYDNVGNLQFVKNYAAVAASLNGTEYTYNHNHGLIDIIDPLGRPVAKNLYDDSGRLYGQQLGNGTVKLFTHNVDDRTSIVTDLDGRETHINYDDNGNVLEEINIITDGSYGADIVTSYTYDSNNNQETKTIGSADFTWISDFDGDNNQLFAEDPEGYRVRYEDYNARGQEGRIFDELNRETVMHYNDEGNLVSIDMPPVIDPDTGVVINLSASNVINEKGQVTETTDLRGKITNYTYYPSGHVSVGQKWTETTDVNGTATYTYDDHNNVKTEQRQRTVDGSVVTETMIYDYDDSDQLIRSTYPDSTYTETQYDLAGNVDRERDRFGVWTDFDYDAYGRLTLTTYVDETTEIREYSNEGLLESVTDRMGHETTYEYDDASQLWKTIYHNDSYTETKYTPQGWVQFEWDEERNLTEYEYFLNGRRKAVIRHIGMDKIRHEYTYYANGELHTETDPLLGVTTYSINEFDQRITTEFHNGTTVGQRYDAMGARTKQIDQNNRSTRYGYDDLGRLETVTPEVTINGEAVPDTSYTYDEVGNKLTQEDAEGRVTSWTYDYYGRVLTRTLPELMSESFVYDDAARTVAHTDFTGKTNTTYLDNQGRIDHIDYHDGNVESYLYWANGQVHTVTDQHGVTETAFDERDRLDYEIKPDGTRLDYAYDDVGNREQVKVTRGTIITVTDYTFDALNRLDTVTDASGVTSYTYYDNGSLWTVTFPNGVVSEYQYNDVNQLEVLTTKDKDGVVLSSYTYGLDDTGRREDITEADGRYTDYTYDNLYRLTDEVVTEGGLEIYSANYIYDWVGNRKYETVTDGSTVQTEYAYDLNDRLTSQGGTVYTHDDNGNTKTETLDSVVTEYFYDAKNKMTSVDKGGVVTGYAYDANGIRTSKTEGGVTTQFVVDLNRDYAQVLEEVVGDITTAEASATYTYGHDLLNQDRGGDFRFYSYDGLGSTRSLTDVTGAVTDTYNYEAFGDVLSETGSTENSYKYTGEQFDTSLDQYYLRARYLDPSVGRFTQQDTYMGRDDEPASLHKYLYAHADPVRYIDPSGNSILLLDYGKALTILSTMTAVYVTAMNNAGGFLGSNSGDSLGGVNPKIVGLAVLSTMIGDKSKLATLVGAKALDDYGDEACVIVAGPNPSRHLLYLEVTYECKQFKSWRIVRYFPEQVRSSIPQKAPCVPGFPADMMPVPLREGINEWNECRFRY